MTAGDFDGWPEYASLFRIALLVADKSPPETPPAVQREAAVVIGLRRLERMEECAIPPSDAAWLAVWGTWQGPAALIHPDGDEADVFNLPLPADRFAIAIGEARQLQRKLDAARQHADASRRHALAAARALEAA